MYKLLNTYSSRLIAQVTLPLLSLYMISPAHAESDDLYKGIVGYYQSWSSKNTDDGTTTELAQLPAAYSVVNLSFMKTDASYQSGQKTFAGTGLQFNYSPEVLKQAITTLKKRNPNTKVLVAVGGAGTAGKNKINVKDIAAFVRDFDLDGVDLDIEENPKSINCTFSQSGDVNCNTDQKYIDAISELRDELPREQGYIISLAGFSTGAYGEKQLEWEKAKPQGSPYMGIMINPIKKAGDKLDMVFIMSYDADEGRSGYSPKQAFAAYHNYYDGPIFLGIEVPPEGWGNHVLTRRKAEELAAHVKKHGGAGMMVWGITKLNTKNPGVDAECFTMTMCEALGQGDCVDVKNVCPLSKKQG